MLVPRLWVFQSRDEDGEELLVVLLLDDFLVNA
jgi:hypothetical protein